VDAPPQTDGVNLSLNDAQLAVLRWVAEGADISAAPSPDFKTSAVAVASRGLIELDRRRGHWSATVTAKGRAYLEQGHHPDDAPTGKSSEPSTLRLALASARSDMDEALIHGVQVREIQRSTRRRRHEPPRWEVSVRGVLIGWVDERLLPTSSATFYFAVGIDLETGKEHRLEGNTDCQERIDRVAAFQTDKSYRERILSRGRYTGRD